MRRGRSRPPSADNCGKQVARIRAQVERFQCLAGLLVRVHDATLGIEDDDALAEAVEKCSGQRGED